MLTILLIIFNMSQTQARTLEILHTNDIHSHFHPPTHSMQNDEQGNLAILKTIINRERQKSKEDSISSILLDAGDFLEGNLYYMANYGRRSVQMMNTIGYDAVAMGNHDYLMGTKDLEDLVTDEPPKFHFLAANVFIHPNHVELKKILLPTAIIERDGLKIGLIGLTTNEAIYKWRFEGGEITTPIKAAKKYAKQLKEEGVDIVIALTHLGLNRDKSLAKKSKYIDLIVGGHSHDTLQKEHLVRNIMGRYIPIVQAGKHGKWLGKIHVSIDENKMNRQKEVSLLSYELIPIKNAPQNPTVKKLIEDSKDDLYELYGKKWLFDKVGDINRDKARKKKWGEFIAIVMKDKIESDISIHVSSFSGSFYPKGEVNRARLFNAYPRIFDFGDIFGWSIYRARVPGFFLKTLLKVVINLKLPLYMAGVDFKLKEENNQLRIDGDILIDGKEIDFLKRYDVALPEGIIRGAFNINTKLKLLLASAEKTNFLFWESLENSLKKESEKEFVQTPVKFIEGKK
jgi:5'-nucleotidase / UDP-sugar diphosphatase